MKTETMTTNGVDTKALTETMNAIKANTEIARFQFRAGNEWMDGAHNRTTIGDFYGACQQHPREIPHMFDADEPPVLLGRDIGANPVEYLLTGLAACVTTSLVYHAAARGIKLSEVSSRLEGDLDLRGFLGMDPSVRPGYQGIRMKFNIKGDRPQKELEQLLHETKALSPVFCSVSNGVNIQVEMAEEESGQSAMV